MSGSRSTGSRSIALSRKTQTNTVSASGATNLRLVALWTMPLASLSTISTRISTAAWKRPGTPEVALRAARQSRKQPSTPSSDREEDRVEVDDREVDQALRLAGAEMGQVVNDVFTGGLGVLFCGHLSCPGLALLVLESAPEPARARAARTSTTACRAPSTPATPARRQPGTMRAASTSMTTESAIFTNPHHSMLDRADDGRQRRQPAGRAARHQRARDDDDRRAVRRRHARRSRPPTSPRHRHGHGAERRLRGDHAPRREHRMVAPEGLGLGTRHRLEAGLIGVAIGIVERAVARSRDRRRGSPRRGRGAARRLPAQPKIIRRNPPATTASRGHCRCRAVRRRRRSGGMPSSPPIADVACSLSPRPQPRLLRRGARGSRRERCRPPGRRRAASPRRSLPEQLPRVRAEGHRSAAEMAHRGGARRPAEAAAARRRRASPPTSPSCAATPSPARRWCRR